MISTTTVPPSDESAVAAIAAILCMSEDDLADRFVATRLRMHRSLPTKCVNDVVQLSKNRTLAFSIVIGESAVSALKQPARALCDRQDELGAEHNTLIDRANTYSALTAKDDPEGLVVRKLSSHWAAEHDVSRTAAEMTFARLLGLRCVLHVQLERESYERSGMDVPLEWRLPVDADGGLLPPLELELVPVDPKSPGGGNGGDDGDASGGAAPAVVVVMSTDPDPAADTDADDKDDGLDFLEIDLDRKG